MISYIKPSIASTNAFANNTQHHLLTSQCILTIQASIFYEQSMFRKKSNIDRYTKRLQHELSVINQSISITDITITDTSFFNCAERRPTCSVNTLIQSIDLLSKIASTIQESLHFDTELTTPTHKSNCANKMVRLITSEFFFYPIDRPLCEIEFGMLLSEIEGIAMNYHKNLMLVLSSFPVIIPKRGVINVVIHVQCGQIPQISTFAKITPHRLDVSYQQIKASYSSVQQTTSGTFFAKSTQLTQHNAKGIPYGIVCHCSTAGGAEFNTVIDICYDHHEGEAKHTFIKHVITAIDNKSTDFLPVQLSQIITSNVVSIHPDNLISDTFAHADPYSETNNDFHLADKNAWLKCIRQLLPSTEFLFLKNTLLIVDPLQFGRNVELHISKEYLLDHTKGELATLIKNHNKFVISERLSQQLQKSNPANRKAYA